ncbi:MAG: hypothetical protein G01um101417_645 [Parcubacteria group bacterium Gr01-1014_17]|nr:MAG: hypothetical protein G01um101417_645 [Parcubacteria group bacterium Gr01-1014_17]
MKYTKEQRRARFEALSDVLKDFLVSEETADTIGRIAEKNNLDDERTPKLAREIGTVLLGLIPKEKFAEQLVAELSLPPEQARVIAGEVEKKIFGENIPPTPIERGSFKNSSLEGGAPTLVGAEDVSRTPPIGGGRDVSAIKNPPPTPSFIKEGEAGGGFSPPRHPHHTIAPCRYKKRHRV